ncbi:hypothetical protein C1645_836680 [Glomus cerebriforme]|uniref:Uncharacterized protein n=1 Tax=Glomus cerebriforme TaxID=658196 RepID=A0A397S6L5_9GLOM|nr:hypothetical protein C1645_836680 [Glomus cerebriforme]
MIFVVNNLYNKNTKNKENFINNKRLAELYEKWNEMRSFSTINSYTTEIYKSFHKDYIKIPYWLSNKKDIKNQIIKIIQCQSIAKITS